MPLSGASLTRRVAFAAAHRYRRPDWDDARNTAVFGACARPHFHGHSYICDVTVTGPIDATTGMIVDLALLDRVLAAEVHDHLDHRNLTLDIAAFAEREGGIIPTGENLARYIAERVQAALSAGRAAPPAHVSEVRVAEDATLWATYRP
jgi:6-pyruvoyltetrahydropterin/6-carboxytetrahydropterin synthase